MIYDYIIIGGGISGLYTAYKIKQNNKDAKLIILERGETIGGRMNIYNFCGSPVNIGAGVGRENKDFLLIKLLKELNIKYDRSKLIVNYSEDIHKINFKSVLTELKKSYNEKYKNYTFKLFGNKILGPKLYKNFVKYIGYSDYEKEDAFETICHYGLEDNISGPNILYIKWNLLLDELCKYIDYNVIYKKENVIKIIDNKDNFNVQCEDGKTFTGIKVVIASTIDTIKKLLPKYKLYNNIKGQPFLRTYGKFDKKSTIIVNNIINGYTIVNGPLKKIIPINKDNGIYMIAYTDNKDAVYFKNYLDNKEFFCRELEKALNITNNTLNLLAIKSFYWPIGTHYYAPLADEFKSRKDFIRQCQNPQKNLFVVGELISLNQGWTQGALESVENIIKQII